MIREPPRGRAGVSGRTHRTWAQETRSVRGGSGQILLQGAWTAGAGRKAGGRRGGWEPAERTLIWAELEGVGSGSDPASHPKPWLGSNHTFHSPEATGPTRLALLWQGAVTLQMWSLRMGWYCAPLSCLWNQD